ncbi:MULTISPECIES: ABC transporter ATP-binding protein [unclassified Brucella]|uniref:ABC transporter ATP-binding protein n=1 Tax=unclassified Brucella TaxID=2632610 RepID=UPI000972E86D|nr:MULTISPECIES: ABC transporter ATP-binding protein [unclassified Brucella]APX68031.1 ABC transporter ATP-binding protein [Brucella sp. 09RB8471]MRN66314.1 ATP-binding cassette domain-containing protein [Brucella sp. 10RB9213]MRN78241.1 ATP-binding cassette domain-containing protein [Brucella sp. 10RB9210]UWF60474.1 ABC transporter ATP-binding protein [Brucella sp. 2716]
MKTDIITVDNLVVERSGKRVLHGISFSLQPGTISTLLGANGAGKSSTVMALAGAIPTASGMASLGSTRLTGRSPDDIRRMGVAMVPEGHRVLGQMSVEDNLLVSVLERKAAARRDGLARAFAIFPELETRRHQRAGDLSGGQKQMVAMAQAFLSRPRFMIVDELSLGLAPTVVKRLAEALVLAARDGIGVLLIEQFANLALGLASHALVMERGRIVFDGPSQTLQQQPDILHGAYLAD